MRRAKWDYDFRETTLKGFFIHRFDFGEIHLHRIGTWYAVKMGEHFQQQRHSAGERFFGL